MKTILRDTQLLLLTVIYVFRIVCIFNLYSHDKHQICEKKSCVQTFIHFILSCNQILMYLYIGKTFL